GDAGASGGCSGTAGSTHPSGRRSSRSLRSWACTLAYSVMAAAHLHSTVADTGDGSERPETQPEGRSLKEHERALCWSDRVIRPECPEQARRRSPQRVRAHVSMPSLAWAAEDAVTPCANTLPPAGDGLPRSCRIVPV